jgi:ABC-2 type transport system permease protein
MMPDWAIAAEAFNPMYQFVTYFRDIMMWQTTPDLSMNLICLGMAVLQFAIGFLVFRKTEHKFILYV